MTQSASHRVNIPTELIGSMPRMAELVEAQRAHKDGELTTDQLALLQEKDLQDVLFQLQRTGSLQLTDGELSKPSFLNYPIYEITQLNYSFEEENSITMIYNDGHQRILPYLVKAPFQYATFAVEYLRTAQKYTKHPLKQTVIAPSTLSLMYPTEIIEHYSREQFLDDLLDEAEKDIRLCFDAGAEKVQLDFPEAALSFKWDESGKLLTELVEINNRLLNRFDEADRNKLGVHVCSGNDKGSGHSSYTDYLRVLPVVFQLHLTNFYLQSSFDKDPEAILSLIRKSLRPQHRVFIGVIDSMNNHAETSEQVRDRVLRAAKYIPIEQLGTTDNCGFSPYNDDESMTREKCYEKIRARVEGTKMAQDILNQAAHTSK